ncbi:MAG TPA: IS1380 family transposase [Actinomycetota bacterium]|nr:IS1380 family transposase [Actinomycetota bacterium]
MSSSHSLDTLSLQFDDPNLVANAGLVLPATLAQHLGLEELYRSHVHLGDAPGRANVGIKAMTLIGSAMAGGDCIDDSDVLRAGPTDVVLGHGLRAPSTLGTFLRSFCWGDVRSLDRVSRVALGRAWSAGAGPRGDVLKIDLDSSICETYGLAKEGGSRFSYSHVRGYHPMLAVAEDQVLHARLRGGPANSGRGAKSFLAETFARVREAGYEGSIVLRADSGFYNHHVTGACDRARVRWSITAKMSPGLQKIIAAIPEEDWVPIPYFIEGAAVAETTYTPFAARKGARPVRLIVRRVPPTPGSQLALYVDYSHHPLITNRPGEMLALEADHRAHAEVENTIRDLKYGMGLNHLPSGRFGANGAWLALNVMAHNLLRWAGAIALRDSEPMTTKTFRRRLVALPGRLARSGRRLTLHLPERWPWEEQFVGALALLREIRLAV